jgi:hypothetical protein
MKTWTFMQWIIAIIIVAAAIGIMFVVMPLLGFAIPEWAIQIFWILVIAVVAIAAIRFLISLWSNWGGGPPQP